MEALTHNIFILLFLSLTGHNLPDKPIVANSNINLSMAYSIQGPNIYADSLILGKTDKIGNLNLDKIEESELQSRFYSSSFFEAKERRSLDTVNLQVQEILNQANITLSNPSDANSSKVFSYNNTINPQFYTLRGTQKTKRQFKVKRYRDRFKEFDRLIDGLFINQTSLANIEFSKFKKFPPVRVFKTKANLHVHLLGSIRWNAKYGDASSAHGIYVTNKWRIESFNGRKVRMPKALRKHYPNYGQYLIVLGDKRLNNDKLALAISHEIGHSLGLDHVTEPNNLMNPNIQRIGKALTTDQIARIRSGAIFIKSKGMILGMTPICKLEE